MSVHKFHLYFKLALLFFVPLILLELGLRIAGIGGSIVYQRDTFCGYRPKPSQSFSTLGYRVRITDRGFRGPVQNSDTLCLGCSVTYGCAFIPDHETFSARLGALNGGVNGWGVQNMKGFFEHTSLEGIKRVLLIIPTGIILRPFTTLDKGLISTTRKMYFRIEYLFRYIWYGILKMGASNTQHHISSDTIFEENVKAIESIAQNCAERGIELYVISLPNEAESNGAHTETLDYWNKLTERLKTMGIPHMMAWPDKGISGLYYDGCHLSIRGHEWFAGEIRRWLESKVASHSKSES